MRWIHSIRVHRPWQVIAAQLPLVFLVALLGCQDSSHRRLDVPDDLIGVWTTSDSPYEGRSLELRRFEVLIGTGESPPQSSPVLEVTQESLDRGLGFRITCGDTEGDEFFLNLLYDPATQRLRLKNRPQVAWSRGEPS